MLETFTGLKDHAIEQIKEEMQIRKTNEVFLLFSMGSQFDHLIKQSIEKLGVFCLVADPISVTAEDVRTLKPKGIIISGGPASVHSEPPKFDNEIFNLGIPVLGICLGFQMWARYVGVKVIPAIKKEYGVHLLAVNVFGQEKLFCGLPNILNVLESHGDGIEENNTLHILGRTENAPVAAANYHNLWGVQFHPEVSDTTYGPQIFENFCFKICGAKDRFPAKEEAKRKIAEIRKTVGDKKVLLALSGGSDSSTVAYLLKEALGENIRDQVIAVYIKGIDRPDDEVHVIMNFSWLSVLVDDETFEFQRALAGKISMKEKRIAMRGVYKAVLEKEAKAIGASFIAQGTLYTDVSESGGGYQTGSRKAMIKQHHNVNLDFDLPELTPLIDCVKDTGRNIGREVGVPEDLLTRHPFPGTGLVIRIIGEITQENLALARKLDKIYIEELRKWKLYDTVWQAGVVLTPLTTTCTKGDDAGEGFIVLLWADWSVNGFTAQAAELPYDFLKHVDRRFTDEIPEIGSTYVRVTGKPPRTIEVG